MICYYSQDDRASVFDRSSTLKTTTISANKQRSSMEQKRSNFEAEFLSHERSSEILSNDMEHMVFRVCVSRWALNMDTWALHFIMIHGNSRLFVFLNLSPFCDLQIIPIALSLLVFYDDCCVPFNFNKKRRLKENCTTSLRRIIIMRRRAPERRD